MCVCVRACCICGLVLVPSVPYLLAFGSAIVGGCGCVVVLVLVVVVVVVVVVVAATCADVKLNLRTKSLHARLA